MLQFGCFALSVAVLILGIHIRNMQRRLNAVADAASAVLEEVEHG